MAQELRLSIKVRMPVADEDAISTARQIVRIDEDIADALAGVVEAGGAVEIKSRLVTVYRRGDIEDMLSEQDATQATQDAA